MGAEFSAGRVHATHAVEVIDVMEMGVGAAAEAFVQLCSSAGFTVVALGPAQFRAARARRPQWATITAILTAVFCGLGLLLLLVKRTESADAVIVEDRTGIQMRITGALPPELMAQIRSVVGRHNNTTYVAQGAGGAGGAGGAVSGWAPSHVSPKVVPPPPPVAMPPPVAAPPRRATEPDPLGATVLRSSLVVPGQQAASLILPDGTRIVVGAGVVIGRAPVAEAALMNATLVALGDASLSKTHLSVSPAPDGVWVVDHHSTNGTRVTSGASNVQCVPGERTSVAVGSVVVAGELRLTVAVA